MKLSRRLLFILFTFSLSSSLFASDFKEISTKDGLANRRVYSCAKDAQGFLWAATRAGLNRYDGHSFRLYYLSGENGIESPRGVCSSDSGTLMAFSEDNVFNYDGKVDTFRVVSSIKTLRRERINAVLSLDESSLLIGTSENLYSLSGGDFAKISDSSDAFLSFSLYKNNQVLAGTDHDVRLISPDGSVSVLVGGDSLSNDKVESILYDPASSRIWVGTFSNGLYIFDVKEGGCKLAKHLPTSYPIRSICLIDDDLIWVGVDGSGIYSYSRFDLGPLEEFNMSKTDNNKINANGIYHILDDDGLIWVSTFSAGIQLYKKNNFITSVYKRKGQGDAQNPGNSVTCLLEDSGGNLWVGGNDGLARYSVRDGSWKEFDSSSSVILSVCEDRKGQIWACGYANDIICVGENGIVTRNNINAESAKSYYNCIYEDDDGVIWFAGITDGLTSFNPVDSQIKNYGIKGISSILRYNKDSLLLSTIRGIGFFDKVSATVNYLTLNRSDLDVSNSLFVEAACIDPSDGKSIWYGSNDFGLFRYDAATKTSKRYTVKDGLSSNNISSIIADNYGDLWVGTESGLNFIDLPGISVESVNAFGNDYQTFNYRAVCKKKDGSVLFGTNNGAIEVSPEKHSSYAKVHNEIILEELYLHYKEIKPGARKSPLKLPLDETEKLVLKHNDNSFSISFTTLDYSSSSQTLYECRLYGFDKTWSPPRNETVATYTNVPSGRYRFEVRVFRNGDIGKPQIRSVNITIRPHFLGSVWAIIIYFGLGISALLFIIRAAGDKVEARNSDEKIKFFINIAHDIRTPLTLIKAPLNEITNEEGLSHDGRLSVNLAKKNVDKLLNMVTQLLDFQKAEREAMTLQTEETDINEFLEYNAANFRMAANQKGINFTLDVSQEIGKGFIDRRKVSIIVDNLLSNAIKYTRPKGNVSLKAASDSGIMVIKVIDDGIGIPSSEQQKLFNRFYRAENAANTAESGSGIGLLLCKKMAELHKGKITFSSAEKIGTCFTVSIPICRKFYSSNEITERVPETAEPNPNPDNGNDEEKSKFKLLLVEDNSDLRDYLANVLSRTYCVITAKDGVDALEVVSKDPPDFIISDVLMPRLNGMELCGKLKSDISTCHIPIILLTSLSEREDIIKGFNAGADDYVTKPFDLSVLESKISAIINNRRRYSRKYADKTAFEDDAVSSNDLDKKFMRKVVGLVEEKMADENFSIDTLASEMAMSRTVFYKKIKSITMRNPQEMVRDIRMKKAAGLLRSRKYSVEEVAWLVGYNNSKYFSTSFKKYYNLTPSEFAEKDI